MVKGMLEQFSADERLKHEIEKYKWIESEKVGYDSAAESWFKLYGSEWVKFHNLPGAALNPKPILDKPSLLSKKKKTIRK